MSDDNDYDVKFWNDWQFTAFCKLAKSAMLMKMMTLLSSVRSEHVVRHSGDIDLIVLASKRDILHTMVTTTMMMVVQMI